MQEEDDVTNQISSLTRPKDKQVHLKRKTLNQQRESKKRRKFISSGKEGIKAAKICSKATKAIKPMQRKIKKSRDKYSFRRAKLVPFSGSKKQKMKFRLVFITDPLN